MSMLKFQFSLIAMNKFQPIEPKSLGSSLRARVSRDGNRFRSLHSPKTNNAIENTRRPTIMMMQYTPDVQFNITGGGGIAEGENVARTGPYANSNNLHRYVKFFQH